MTLRDISRSMKPVRITQINSVGEASSAVYTGFWKPMSTTNLDQRAQDINELEIPHKSWYLQSLSSIDTIAFDALLDATTCGSLMVRSKVTVSDASTMSSSIMLKLKHSVRRSLRLFTKNTIGSDPAISISESE